MEKRKMTTPNRREIIERARELWHSNRARRGDPSFDVTPELAELREEGFLSVAQSELMRNEARAIEEEWRGYNELEDLDAFPIEGILREGAFCVGSRGCGKTNLLKLLVVEALKRKIRVKVFDPSLAWKSFFLEKIRVKRKSYTPNLWNRIYDTSRLSVLEAREFVSEMLAKDVEEAIVSTDMGYKPKVLVVIEEAQNVVPSHSLRTKRFLEISRFVTQSRNFGMSYIASTQRLASVDVNLVEISGVKYFFKLEGHRNLTKVRYWLSKFDVWRLRDLSVGECILQVGSKTRLLRLPKFGVRNKAKIALMSRDVSNPNATVLS